MDKLPIDLIRFIASYLNFDDVMGVKFLNKSINNILNNKFFQLYWDTNSPTNFKLYYEKRPNFFDNISNLNKCKKLELIKKTDNTLRDILTCWNICIDDNKKNGWVNNSLYIYFMDANDSRHIISFYPKTDDEFYIKSVNKKYPNTTFLDLMLNILHGKQDDLKLQNLINIKIIQICVYVDGGDTHYEFLIGKVLYSMK